MGNDQSKVHDQNEPASVELEDGSRISKHCENGEIWPYHYDGVRTVYEAFQRGQRVSNDGPCLGRRSGGADSPYERLSYSAVSARADAFGAGLVSACGLRAANSTHVGIFSQNRVEWVVADQACVRYSMVLVPLYATLGREACVHIVNQAELSAVVCDTAARAAQLLEMGGELACLRHVVVMDEAGAAEAEALRLEVEQRGWSLHWFGAVEASGRESPLDLCPALPDDVYTICYTSGTTGVPKGVVLTHSAITMVCASSLLPLQKVNRGITPDDVALSYLPLAHGYERMATATMLQEGGSIAFFGGDLTKLVKDVQAARPTVLCAVPRVLYRIYDQVHAAASVSNVKRKLLDSAVAAKMKYLSQGFLYDNTLWDRWVLYKVRDIFGGRLRHLSTGSAPIAPHVMNFFRIALNCTIYSGYGQTETTAVTSVSSPFDFRGDHVGPPLVCNRVKLVDVPELGYYADKGYGEVCVLGPNVFREYYKMPEKTAETIDADGWLHTGDVGTWTPQGNLQIVDRCKQIFKLSQGEYIAPEKIESVLQRCQHVAQVYVDGESDKSYLVAVVVPDFDALGITLSLKEVDKEAVCDDPEVAQRIVDEMSAMGRENGLKGFEIVRRVHLHPTPFTVENGLLTSTLKSKRFALKKKFSDVVRSLYDENDE